MSENNGNLVKSLYAAFSTGDVPTVLGVFDPNIEWKEAENGPLSDKNPYIGPQAILEGVFMRCMREFEGFTVHPINVIDGGDTVAVEGRYAGKAHATGIVLDAQFVHVWQFRDGKLVRFQQYTDTAQWSKAAGY
jgi:ketosteroid isomerase-like protein